AGLSVERRTRGWRGILGKPESPTLVAEVGGELVGFVGVGPSRDAEGEAELYAIYLDPRHFGTGVGRALMDAAVERLRELVGAEASRAFSAPRTSSRSSSAGSPDSSS